MRWIEKMNRDKLCHKAPRSIDEWYMNKGVSKGNQGTTLVKMTFSIIHSQLHTVQRFFSL